MIYKRLSSLCMSAADMPYFSARVCVYGRARVYVCVIKQQCAIYMGN